MDRLWTVRVVTRTPPGQVFVRNIYRINPLWKFPGGGRKPEDVTPIDTMARELREEIGIIVNPLQIYLIESTKILSRRVGEEFHDVHYGFVDLTEEDIPWIRYQEDEDEEPRHFRNEEILHMPDLLPANREFLIKHGLWPK